MDNDSKNFEKEKTMKNGEERNIGDNKPKAESSGNYLISKFSKQIPQKNYKLFQKIWKLKENLLNPKRSIKKEKKSWNWIKWEKEEGNVGDLEPEKTGTSKRKTEGICL